MSGWLQQRRRGTPGAGGKNPHLAQRADLHYLPDDSGACIAIPIATMGKWPRCIAAPVAPGGADPEALPIRSVRQGTPRWGPLARGRRYSASRRSWIVDREWCGLARWGGPDWDTSPTQHMVREWYAEAIGGRRGEAREFNKRQRIMFGLGVALAFS
jgi:hypothetical protein